MKDNFESVKNLVGNVTKENLKYVDYYVSKDFGIFIPVVGYCEYAIIENHTHPAYSFILYLNNESSIYPCTVKVKEDEYLVQAISPDFPHTERKEERFNRYIAILISKEIFEEEYSKYSESIDMYRCNSFKVNKNTMTYIKRYIDEVEANIHCKEEVINSLINIVIHDVIRGLVDAEFKESKNIKRIEVKKAVNYMNQSFSDKITISNLASVCNMSESSFSRIFKEELLVSPMEYLINIRINKAKKLLRSKSKNITEIALECGFSSLSHFSSSFIKHEKISPREYEDKYK